MSNRQKLLDDTATDVRRLKERERAPATWAGIAFYGGTVGLLFVVPIVGGASVSYTHLWPLCLATSTAPSSCRGSRPPRASTRQ